MRSLNEIGTLAAYQNSNLTNAQRALVLIFLTTGSKEQAVAFAYPNAPKDELAKYARRYFESENVQKLLQAILQPSKSERVLKTVADLADRQVSAEAKVNDIRVALLAGIAALDIPGVAVKAAKK
jgi:hypothetical protein